ncbi:hypothetical protein FIBSPDRAFT_784327 [Athelia psychrophila]|uniref:C3H1-type domain-containing protein n=1 Tax=Athelia psychrophila TaxID=1759441 RepID=A0A166N0R8_9AGAM|nr:hypothetical protein FIBSPDRAFT_784327 [Fibularhizoctonia sp. CBS 109695]
MLAESVREDFTTKYQLDHFHLYVYVFYNKRGLVEAIGRAGHFNAKHKFDDFTFGFNQAAERFIMVDVGSGKEQADAKIKVHLEDNIRLPQTSKILFAGCHDNGYAISLRSLITAGFQDKLVLLRGYTESAASIDELSLPTLTVPNLFIPDKLVTVQNGPNPGFKHGRSRSASFAGDISQAPRSLTPLPPSSLQNVCTSGAQDPKPKIKSELPALEGVSAPTSTQDKVDALPFASEPAASLSRPPAPPSYKSALQAAQVVAAKVPLSKHKPPPCTLFYIANCKHGAECKYSHEYILQEEHYETIRSNALKAPCPAKNRNEVCLFGEQCCYGHACPATTKCHFYAQGRCKFRGAGMHSASKP